MSPLLYEPKLSSTRLRLAVEARQHEIGLFWRRALFFWGFIGSAFIALTVTYSDHPFLAIAVSCFGLLCSVCWSLVNRGSKYWQEAWEAKVAREEEKSIGILFEEIEKEQNKGCWLSGKRFSVSRLAIALSDFVAILWLSMLAYQILTRFTYPLILRSYRQVVILAFPIFTIVYIVALIFCTRAVKK